MQPKFILDSPVIRLGVPVADTLRNNLHTTVNLLNMVVRNPVDKYRA